MVNLLPSVMYLLRLLFLYQGCLHGYDACWWLNRHTGIPQLRSSCCDNSIATSVWSLLSESSTLMIPVGVLTSGNGDTGREDLDIQNRWLSRLLRRFTSWYQMGSCGTMSIRNMIMVLSWTFLMHQKADLSLGMLRLMYMCRKAFAVSLWFVCVGCWVCTPTWLYACSASGLYTSALSYFWTRMMSSMHTLGFCLITTCASWVVHWGHLTLDPFGFLSCWYMMLPVLMCVLGHAVHLLPLANATIYYCCLGAWAKFWKGWIMVYFAVLFFTLQYLLVWAYV